MSALLEKKRAFDAKISEILAAIKNQRFYHFDGKDKENVFFDSETGLLFTFEDDASKLSLFGGVVDVQNYPTNDAGFDDWEIATLEDFWKAREEFRRYNDEWRINYNGQTQYKRYLSVGNMLDNLSSHQLNISPTAFCSHALAANYSSEPRHIFELFIKNNLVPKFNENRIK